MGAPSSRKGRMTPSGSASATAAASDPSAASRLPTASASSARRISTLSRSQPWTTRIRHGVTPRPRRRPRK
jgi:hypothetical protein